MTLLTQLRDLVGQLDALVPKEGAKLLIPSDPDGNTTIGTERGYLRLGIELLRATLDRPPEFNHEIPRISLDLDYLLSPGSQSPFDLCEIDEEFQKWHPPTRPLGPFGQLVLAVVGVVILGLIVVGAFAIASWLF